MNRFLTVSVFILLLVSCESEKTKTDIDIEHIVIVNEAEFNSKRIASDIFSEIKLLPLETSDNFLIGDISKIVPVGNSIFLQDNKDKSIVQFDRGGKFLKKIRRHGRGPGEYITLGDFTVTRSGKIIILDGEYNKLIFLDKDGTYLSQQDLPVHVDALECINDSIIVFNGTSRGDRVILWDIQKEKVVASYIKYDIKYTAKIFKPLIKYREKIYFQRDKSSLIHNVTAERLEKKWYIDFGERNIDLDKMIHLPQFYGIYVSPPNTAEIDEFSETDEYISLNFKCTELSEYPYYLFYSKSTGRHIFINYNHYQDDMIFYKFPLNTVTVTDSGEFVAWVMPVYWRENMALYNSVNMKGEELNRWNNVQQQMKKIDDFDNPILFFFTLKDF